ncbi:MAG: OadG family protein [Deltaproteobacteria bacterium]|nr:OadG family protein [Deltaproteobacteria bacterium]
MLLEGLRIALIGFSTVFIALIILEISVNLMSFFVRKFEKKKEGD